MMCEGKQVFRIRTEDIETNWSEYDNRWIYNNTIEDGKTVVMVNIRNDSTFLHIPTKTFEVAMQAYFTDDKSDEEDIL